MKDRVILHSDANSFYASVECALDGSLKNKSVAVCGSAEDRRGIVLAKSESAKRMGVKTGMPNWEAKRLCPDLVIVPPHFSQYERYSAALREIYSRYTDLVEPYGLDECWLDISHIRRDPWITANEIRMTVKEELGITVSIGVSFNKVFAKLGSDLKKPDAVTVIAQSDFRTKIWQLPCSDLLYCGRATAAKLERYGIRTIGELARAGQDFMSDRFGKNGVALWQYANGLDASPVAHKDHSPPPKSVGHGITCVTDLETEEDIYKVIVALSQDIGFKLRAQNMRAKGLQLSLKDDRLQVYTHSRGFTLATQSEYTLANEALTALREMGIKKYKIRAVTVAAIRLESADAPLQTQLFCDYSSIEKRERFDKKADEIRKKFGKNAIVPAVILDEDKMPKERQTNVLPGKMHE